MMILRHTILLLLFTLATTLSAQVVIKDIITRKPIPFVHIFNPEGYLEAISDINGRIAPEDIEQLSIFSEAPLVLHGG